VSGTPADTTFLMDIPIDVVVELGRTQLTVRELSMLGQGDVVRLDRVTSQPVDLLAGGQLFGRGEIVTEGDRVALRVVELVGRTR
jgi:flagellar motor switch protein FliN/FliY